MGTRQYPVCDPTNPVFPCTHPQFAGVVFLGDWGETTPQAVIDTSRIFSAQDYVDQVRDLGAWASADQLSFAAKITADPGGYYVDNGIVLPDSVFRNTIPRIATIGTAGLLSFGLYHAFFGAGELAAAAAAGGGGAPVAVGTGSTAAAIAAAAAPLIKAGALVSSVIQGGDAGPSAPASNQPAPSSMTTGFTLSPQNTILLVGAIVAVIVLGRD